MSKIFKNAVVALLKAFSYLPFWMIYGLSDFFYVIVYHVVGYRKKVVFTNLKKSFPEKSNREFRQIAREFYRHFCDISLESIKLHSISYKELDKRISLTGHEKLNAYFEQGKSIIILGMHYNNWEWNSSIQRFLKHQLTMIYNPVRNNHEMERFILNMRERFGGQSVPVNLSARTAIQFDKDKKPGILWLAADQTPFQTSKFWTTFFNQETPFFQGPDKIAVKTNQPVFFVHFQKKSRGRYHTRITELFPEPAKEKPETILMTYIELIERIIKNEPSYWLWSHRRWKHKRSEETPLLERQDVSQYIPEKYRSI